MKTYKVIFVGQDQYGTFCRAYKLNAMDKNDIESIILEQSKKDSFILVEIDEVVVSKINTKFPKGVFRKFGKAYFEI